MKAFNHSVKTFEFGDIFGYSAKSSRKASEGRQSGKYPFYTSSQRQVKWIDEADFTEDALILGTGGGPSVNRASCFSTSTDVFVAVPKMRGVSTRYVYYFLTGNINLLEKGFKGVGLKHISKSYLNKLKIPLPVDQNGQPDYSAQEKLSDEFDHIEALRMKNLKLIKLLDEYIPALYNDCFKSADFPTEYIKDLVSTRSSIRTGPFGSQLLHSEFTQEGVPVLGIDNVVTNQFRWARNRHIPVEKYEKFKKFQVYSKDILVTIMGTVGRVCIAPDNLSDAMSTKHLCVITFDQKKIIPQYIWAALLYDQDVRRQTKRINKGAIMEGWNSQIIKNLSVMVPPKPLQKEFSQKLKEIQNLRHLLMKQKDLYGELFKSTLHNSLVAQLSTLPLEVEKKRTHQEWFAIKQGIGVVLGRLAQTSYERGEMVIAKYIYLLQEVYKVPFGLKFVKHKFGPYDPDIKRAIISSAFNKDKFFTVKGAGDRQVYSLGNNSITLMKYSSDILTSSQSSLDELMQYTANAKSRDIERLATVCKIIQDSKSNDEQVVINEMKEWKDDKFSPEEVKRTLAFVRAQAWDVELIG